MGKYELIDFVTMLIGFAVSGEPTLRAFCERVQPFASAFMALFGRADFPTPPTLSRYLAVLDQPCVEALLTLVLEDLLAHSPFGTTPGGLWDRLDGQWLLIDVDGTKQAARQRALPATPDLHPAHRRFIECVLQDTWGASVGKWSEHGRRSDKRIHISFWVRLETLGKRPLSPRTQTGVQRHCKLCPRSFVSALPRRHSPRWLVR
jgi:hypothetical protein